MDKRSFNCTETGGFARRPVAYRMTTRQITLNQQTIFRTIEGRNELFHVAGPGPEIIH